jgi:hypothetical protein
MMRFICTSGRKDGRVSGFTVWTRAILSAPFPVLIGPGEIVEEFGDQGVAEVVVPLPAGVSNADDGIGFLD